MSNHSIFRKKKLSATEVHNYTTSLENLTIENQRDTSHVRTEVQAN